MTVTYEWRGDVDGAALAALHAEGFGGPPAPAPDRVERLRRHSLGWVCAREAGHLVGFVNVAWDGGVHAFLLDTVVSRRCRGRGVGTALVARATEGARAAGCEWLHVDYEDPLHAFYADACGFRPTRAGLIPL
ncbi:GNAT family N-acetyltransferase [Streptomyces sp. NPDC058653]|uniref:GNAT family N-acetyltransferase n=1 Tax=Streptomyces sp. NPDC058653 TaxID=3346576 RepID=UPI0036481BB1